MTRLLEGEVVPDIDPEIERLRARVRTLERESADAKVDAKRAREDADRALSALRRQLSPLYRALQAVFGELDAAGVNDAPAAPTPANNAAPGGALSPVWDAWKRKLTPSCGQMIDALLMHGPLDINGVIVATGISRKQTIYDSVSLMKKAGILDKNGDKYTLRQL